MQLHITTQCNKSINVYYVYFHRIVGNQKRMKYTEYNHIYYYIFITELNRKVNTEVLYLFESLHIEDMKFHKVLELAKCVEQTVRLHAHLTNQSQNQTNKIKTNTNVKSDRKGSHSPSQRSNYE